MLDAAVAPAVLSLAMALLPASGGHDEDWSVEETQVKTYDYLLPPGAILVEVDDYTGAIRVRASAQPRVTATVRETVRAASPARAAQARREVELEAVQDGGTVRFLVDGPFRCRCAFERCGDFDDDEHGRDDDCRNQFFFDRDLPYEVQYDFELTVPARADLTLRTVNRGDIEVEGVEGAFMVRNINGAVALERVAGSGSARTVNGGVTVDLVRGPADSWRLVTVNGDVELRLPAGSGVEASLQTMNGEAWSDFPYVQLPPTATARKERDGRWVYRSEGARLRLGSGGPHVVLETLNGDIFIRQGARTAPPAKTGR